MCLFGMHATKGIIRVFRTNRYRCTVISNKKPPLQKDVRRLAVPPCENFDTANMAFYFYMQNKMRKNIEKNSCMRKGCSFCRGNIYKSSMHYTVNIPTTRHVAVILKLCVDRALCLRGRTKIWLCDEVCICLVPHKA